MAPLVESSIAVEAAVDYSGLYQIFVSFLFSKSLSHYSTTIAQLSLLIRRLRMRQSSDSACAWTRDGAVQSHSLSQRGSCSGRGGKAEIVWRSTS